MRRAWLLLVFVPLAAGQDLGEVTDPIDEALGQTLPPAMAQAYAAIGQNITREDVRMSLEVNFTKGTMSIFGLLIGTGRAEVEAKVDLRVEMRVISSDRIRAAAEGENAYNVSAENATFLSEVFLPAEVFRATLTAEAMAQFQQEQELALADYLERAVPELDVLGLAIEWSNTEPFLVPQDTSLTEPPITVEISATIRYLRTESVQSLLDTYMEKKAKPEDPKKAYIDRIKRENGDPLRARDFFSAAAYTQLLNMSMQPGWSLDVDMRVPRGYSFEYANSAVERHSDRHVSFSVDATDDDDESQEVLLVSLTHRRAVALALFSGMLIVGFLVGGPLRLLYARYRLKPED